MNGADGIAVTAVALLTGFGDDAGGFDADESFFTKCGNIFLNGVNAHTNCTANGFIAGIVLISFAVFAVEQVGVDGDFSGRQVEKENHILQREIVFICFTHALPPVVFCSTQAINFSFGTTMRFFIARYQMFSQVYFHPVRRAFDYHVENATKEVLQSFNYKDGRFLPPTSMESVQKYLDLDDWAMYGAFKDGRGGKHGKIILTRTPYKCRKEWDTELSKKDRRTVSRDIKKYGGFLDEGAVTKWYKLDKDVPIYDAAEDKSYPLSFKSKLINVMPGLPKTTRLFISQEGIGADYEFKY